MYYKRKNCMVNSGNLNLGVINLSKIVSLFNKHLVTEVLFHDAHCIVTIFKIEKKYTVLLKCYLLI